MLGTTTSRLSADARLLPRPGDPQVDGPRGRRPVGRGAARRGEAAAARGDSEMLAQTRLAGLEQARSPRGGSSKQQRSDGTAHSCSRPNEQCFNASGVAAPSAEAATISWSWFRPLVAALGQRRPRPRGDSRRVLCGRNHPPTTGCGPATRRARTPDCLCRVAPAAPDEGPSDRSRQLAPW